jgi:hypothetical protein
MLVLGGYIITNERLRQIGLRRRLIFEDGRAFILNVECRSPPQRFALSTIREACSPQQQCHVFLIASRTFLVHLADCQPFEQNEDDLKVKLWVKLHGITNAAYIAIPDPLDQYNEDGCDSDSDH